MPQVDINTSDELRALTQSHTFAYDTELPAQVKYTRMVEAPHVIVEIGAAYGGSATLFLLNSDVLVYSIDPFIPDPNTGWCSNRQACINAVRAGCTQHTESRKRWRLWQAYSNDAVKDWATYPRPIGLLFVDGDHSYEACRADVDQWLPFVAQGGYMLLHDSRRLEDAPDAEKFARGWQGPTQVADELRRDKRVKLVEEVYSLTVWQVQ
jgi:hypothetical protein